ncbi:hypothetical protein Cgig2_033107 [Carnegiea gigantea]|uniref:Diacylglycerol kinase n=1 Tax=Carnegiea gigantea TaxID=171969 RepID=A0A9Q1K045_9CARY|nr:hypothetical protein Cgig2_033107 [Carnegiea gigantea]
MESIGADSTKNAQDDSPPKNDDSTTKENAVADDSPTNIGNEGGDSSGSSRHVSRSSMIDSLIGLGLSGGGLGKEELKKRISMPEYIRIALRRTINSRNVEAGVVSASLLKSEEVDPPEGPIVVFINSRSGGRHGPELKLRLQHLMSEEQVFDLSEVKPNEFVQYGLRCLEQLASGGDLCAKEIRQRLRIVVAGGDGTVGWVLGCLGVLFKEDRLPFPPVAIIPLGTGNDLSRSFGWGGSFPFAWKSAVKRTLHRASTGPMCYLDSWHASLMMPAGEAVELPHCMKATEEFIIDQDMILQGQKPEKVACFDGVFYNYFSIGMDAQVAYGFHNLRNEKPYLAQGPIANKESVLPLRRQKEPQLKSSPHTRTEEGSRPVGWKEPMPSRVSCPTAPALQLIYSGYSCSQGWFFTPCMSDPALKTLGSVLKIRIKKMNSTEWEKIKVPPDVRAIVALNLHNYGSGRQPWGTLSPDYLEKRGFVEANADDGLLEIFGLKHGWHASFVMVELISAKHIAQASAIRFEIISDEWKQAYLQMDGEPWKQPLDKEYKTYVDIWRVPNQSIMVRGD